MQAADRKAFRRNIPWSFYWKSSLRTKRILNETYSFVATSAWAWPAMYITGALLFTNFSGDPFLWRSFNPDAPNMVWLHNTISIWGKPLLGYSNHHFLNLMIVGLLCFPLAYYFERATKPRLYSRFRWNRFLAFGVLATYGSVLVWAIHEGYWWIVAIGVHNFAVDPKWFLGFGNLIALGFLFLTEPLQLYFPKRFLVALIPFYACWAAAGFPITEWYTGNTGLYLDLTTNGFWEFGGWLYAGIAFYILERKGLLQWWLHKTQLLSSKSLSTETLQP